MSHTFILLYFYHLLGFFVAETNVVKTVSVTEGDSATLDSEVSEIQGDDSIEWTFGSIRVARMKGRNGIFSMQYSNDWKFAGRVQLHNQTGSLTIRNSKSVHSGVYDLSITVRSVESTKSYRFTVYAPLPSPVIFVDTLQYLSSSERSSKFVLLCSVLDVSHVTLSWHRGSSLLSSVSASDLSVSLSLPLEVEYQDKNTYICVINNPISNQTRHLDISDLHWLSSGVFCDETAEVSVKKGDSVTLHSDFNGTQTWTEWRFENVRIARIKIALEDKPQYEDERFRDRLKMDQTGSLTINNMRITDSGLYQLSIFIGTEETIKKFNVTVNEASMPSVHTVLISAAAAGSLLIVVTVVIFCICINTDQDIETVQTQITYVNSPFHKQNAQKANVKQETEVIYAGVNTRR